MKHHAFAARGAVVLFVTLALILLARLALARRQEALSSTAFTYQGELQEAGSPAAGSFDFRFRLWDAPDGGAPIGAPVIRNNVPVEDGRFTVTLDFGDVFDGQERYLEIAVRPAGSSTNYTVLNPRQPLTATPYSLTAGKAQSAPWSGLTGVPTGFADGTDNDTTYAAGAGLSLQGNEFNVSTLPMPGWSDIVVDSGNVGIHNSMIIGLDGLPVISYYDDSNDDLKVAHCHDLQCGDATVTTVDSAGLVGKYTSITIGRNGSPLISYYDESNGDLKVASCNDAACTGAELHAVDTAENVGLHTGITTNASGYAFISYYDATNGDLKAVSCGSLDCTDNTIWTVEAVGNVGQYTSVTRSAYGTGYISYYDATNGDLKIARCTNMNCSAAFAITVDGTGTTGSEEDDVGHHSTITMARDDYPLIAYAKVYQAGTPASVSQLRVAHCTNLLCNTADVRVLLSANDINWQGISLTIGRDGLGMISAGLESTNEMVMFYCTDIACSSLTYNGKVVPDGAGDSALTIGADGLPVLAYRSDTDNALHLLHCSDWSCQPYLRRR